MQTHVSHKAIWVWRAGLYVLSVLLLLVKFHLPWAGPLTQYSFSLNLLAPIATLWIAREVAFWRGRAATRRDPWLDQPGRASFSVYLLHPVALLATRRLTDDHGVAGLMIFLLLTALFTAIFYYLVERPSHQLAQRVGRASSVRVAV